jgi:uncharacterized protein YbaP (TraB family)
MRALGYSRKLKHLLPALLVAAFLPAQTGEAPKPTEHPFLWRFEHEGTEHFLYGTIHLPDPRVTTLPKSVEQAHQRADAVFTEIRMDQVGPSAMAKMALPQGQTLSELAGTRMKDKLTKFAEDSGMGMMILDRMKPWVVATQVQMSDIMERFEGVPPLDLMLLETALEEGREVGELETFASQIEAFDSFPTGLQLELLDLALDAHEAGDDQIETVVQTYLAGDSREFDKVMAKQYAGHEELRKTIQRILLDDRNVHMVDRILEEITEHPERSCFFAVGAAHMTGNTGLVTLLRRKGYRVDRLSADGKPTADEPPAKKKESEDEKAPATSRKAG